jgi:hypothetical protein
LKDLIDTVLTILAPIAALGFIIEYVWSHNLEQLKPKTGTQGQPLYTTPPSYMRNQEQIDKETPIIAKYNDDLKIYSRRKRRFDNAMPIVKRIRLYCSLGAIFFGVAKIAYHFGLN